ncbi:MAG: hypothetical protein ACQEXB_22550 [Bacillota bacterium]
MDLRIEVGEKEKGKVKYEALPAFQYFFREMGFDVTLDTLNQSVQLTSPLPKKKIVISSEENGLPHPFRKPHLERNVLKQIQRFLEESGAEVFLTRQKGGVEATDLHLKFTLLEVPNIREPLLELTSYSKYQDQKLVEAIQSECKKMNMKFKLNDPIRSYDSSTLKLQILSPVISNDEFWKRYGEKYALSITSGIFAKFLGKSPLSFFSFVPVENLLSIFSSPADTEVSGESVQEMERKATKENTNLEKINLDKTNATKTKEAEVFFDYNLIIDESENQKIQVLSHLHIKNIGTEILHNPVICIRATPSKNVKVTGQILPHNFAQTKGVSNQDGAKGWLYMNEKWIDEFEEKGEIWICPIQSIDIPPRQTESLSNLQISLLDYEHKTIRVEAFVFFINDELEFRSNNKISVSSLKKVSSIGEKEK